jgi:8-oxo-dGTP pyrophosphatase MutT (NUDIX family)
MDSLAYTSSAIKTLLASHQARTVDLAEGLRPAAVLAPFQDIPEKGLSLIFTKRTDNLDNHRGQISFPGGMMDPEDAGPRATALRETFEEIGVRPEDVDLWGRLNQEATVTGFSVAPFVGRIPHPYAFNLNRQEVERLIVVPLDHLLDPAFFSQEYYHWNDRYYKTYKYQYGDDVIWGATARMVHNLLSLLTSGREPEDGGPIVGLPNPK